MAAGGSTRAIVAALLANLGIAIAKFVGFVLTRASSMPAESIHSLADSGNQGLLLLGGRRAQQKPTAQHPFGYGRERYFWAFVVSVVLFALGSLFALFEGIEKLRHPHELASPQIAAGILAVGIVLEAFSFRTAIAEAITDSADVRSIDAAEPRVRAAVPIARVIYLEPARTGDDANVGGLSATADGAGPQPERDVPASEADHHG